MRIQLFLSILVGTVCLVGCDSGPRTVPVQGIVNYKGQPLAGGFMFFSPEDPAACRPGTAVIGADGRFRATTARPNDGLMVGSYRVSIDTSTPQKGEADKFAKKPAAIPSKYQDLGTSGLTVQVERSDAGKEFKLELSD